MNYKVPSVSEIKEKFQRPFWREPFSYYAHRPISRRLTWVLLHFTLWAEFIALMTPVVDLITIFLIFKGHFIWAAIFTQLHIIIDGADGEVARFRGTVRKRTAQQNRFGAYVDSMAGFLVYPLVIFSAGYFLGNLVTGLVAMLAFCVAVVSSAYAGYYFPSKGKKSQNLRKKLFGKTKLRIGFNSSIQKTLITLALLFQTVVFIWIFVAGLVALVGVKFYVYRK